MTTRKKKSAEAPDFERSLVELEETVRRLEGGDLALEQSLAAFEKGIALVRTLHARLDAVQMRIDELTQGPGGGASLVPGALAAPADGDEVDGDEDDQDSDDDDDEAGDEDPE